MEFRAAGPRGRRAEARGRGLQLTARGAPLGCAETLRLCQGLRCNKGLPLPHSRACRTALSRPRLRGDSGSAHQFAAASASLPLPLARPPTPPLAARGTRGRLLVATSFCVGPGRLALPAARAPGRRLEQHSRPSPLGRLGPPPVCTAGRQWDSPRGWMLIALYPDVRPLPRSHDWGPWQRRPKRGPTPALATPAGAHARTQARTPAGVPLASQQPGHVGRAREAAREQPAGCVSGRSRVLCAAREPAPPAQRSPPAAAAESGATMDTASHSLVLLQQLNMQREFGFLCDCTVAIGDVYFKAHRAVLAAFSNYFKMIFIHQTSECIKIQPADIQPDIFSYLLHIMYTGKGPKQIVDHSRLEEGIRFLHADYLSHIATEMNQVFSPETVQTSNLYGIQISTTQKTAVKQGLEIKDTPPSSSGNRAAAPGDHPQLQLSLAIGLDDGGAEQQRAHPAAQALEEHQKPPVTIKQERCDPESVISQSHSSSSSEVTGSSFTENSVKVHLCHYCGERFESRSNLRQHLHTHVSGSLPFGVPASILESNDLGEVHPLSGSSEALECRRLGSFLAEEDGQQPRPPEHSGRGPSEPLQISQVSVISKDTEPVELNCNFSFSRKRKISCTICGHKFLRKSQLLEHMYTHKGKSYRYNRCQRFGNSLAQRFQQYCDSWPDVSLKTSRLSQEHLDLPCALESEMTQAGVDTILVE